MSSSNNMYEPIPDLEANKVAVISAQVDEVKVIMADNINKTIKRGEDLDALNEKTQALSENTRVFRHGCRQDS